MAFSGALAGHQDYGWADGTLHRGGRGANALRLIGRTMPPPARFVLWPPISAAVAKGLLSSVKFHYGRKFAARRCWRMPGAT